MNTKQLLLKNSFVYHKNTDTGKISGTGKIHSFKFVIIYLLPPPLDFNIFIYDL